MKVHPALRVCFIALLPLISLVSPSVCPLASREAAASETAPPPVSPLLENLDGAEKLTVAGSDGAKRDAKAGDSLQLGDVVATGSQLAATVAFEQGTQVLVSTDSRIQVGYESEVEGEPLVPVVDVLEGDVRVLVDNYLGGEIPAAPATLKSHRFLIRTRSAVMGVRGTDFLVSANDGRVSLNTVSGTVEYAEDLKGFDGPKKEAVGKGQMYASEGAKAYPVHEFLRSYYRLHPQAAKIYKRALLEIVDGTLARKFAAARVRRDEAYRLQKGNTPSEISFPGKKKAAPSPGPSGLTH